MPKTRRDTTRHPPTQEVMVVPKLDDTNENWSCLLVGRLLDVQAAC